MFLILENLSGIQNLNQLSVFYFTFGVIVTVVRSGVLINDNDYDMMMNMMRMILMKN